MGKLRICLCLILCLLLCGCGKPAEPTRPDNGTWGENGAPPQIPQGEAGSPPSIPQGENGLPPEIPQGGAEGSTPMEPSGDWNVEPPDYFQPPDADASLPPEPTEDMTITES